MEEAKKMRPREYIKIRGANEHNLKNINVDIPRNELVVLTGMSGSGKSSLAFDTIYAEGQRPQDRALDALLRADKHLSKAVTDLTIKGTNSGVNGSGSVSSAGSTGHGWFR